MPLSSTNQTLQPMVSGKRRVIALNKKDLANPNIMHVLILIPIIFIVVVLISFCSIL